MHALRAIVSAAWCGSTWTIGYVVAPVLFMTLPREGAGELAARFFRLQAYISLAAGLVLLVMLSIEGKFVKSASFKLVVAMLMCTAIGYFALQPWIAQARVDLASAVPTAEAQRAFALSHGAAAAFYLVQSLLGLWLIARESRPR